MRRNWTKAWFRKGKALGALGRTDEAREAFLLGLEFDPSTQDLIDALSDLDKRIQAGSPAPAMTNGSTDP